MGEQIALPSNFARDMMPQAIAAMASVALAVKLKKIFESKDKYLTFPPGLSFSYDYLEFMNAPGKTSLSAQEQLNYKADFSRLMNMIPADTPVYIPDADNFLWDEVKQILIDSAFAESALTAEEEAQLEEAIDYLSDIQVDSDGNEIPVNSQQVTKYYEYKTLYEEAERTYLDEQFSVQFAEGPEAKSLKEKWDSYREKQLREARDKAEQDWINLGYKRQVEEYQSLRNKLELRKYLNLYRQEYLNELAISELADLNGMGIGFCSTFFSPADVFDKELPWTSITLTKSEIAGLIKEAPPEIKTMYGVEQGAVDIEAITLEYNNVIVMRSWFRPEFFGSRYWKLPDDRVVSDGQTPRNGILPAFITSILVARNIQITRRKESAQHPMVLPMVSKMPIQGVKLSNMVVAKPIRVAPTVRPARPVHPSTSASTVRPAHPSTSAAIVRPAIPAHPSPTATAMRPAAPVSPKVISRPGMPKIRSTFARVKIPGGNIQPAVGASPISLKLRAAYEAKKYNGITIKSAAGGAPKLPPPQADARVPAQSSTLVTEKIDFDGVSVLAFVCKRLPKSPDPDDSLQW